jgi:tetratricopeptide (TPR) repeat protein
MRQGLFAAATFAAATFSLSAQSLPTPEKLSRDWQRLAAPTLEVVGNASEQDLRRAAARIEAFRSVLQTILPGLQLASPQPTRLYVFRDYPSFQKFAPRDGRGRRLEGVGGYFFSAPGLNVMALPIFRNPRRTYEAAFHEYTHYFVDRNLPNAPLWLTEGLAEFYSTTEIADDGTVTIGRAPLGRLEPLQARVLPPLRQLLSGDSARRLFVGGDTTMFYSHAWVFVHYMLLRDAGSRHGQLMQYLALARSSGSIDEAAQKAFGATLEDLDGELRGYARSFKLPALITQAPARRSEQAAVTRLSEVAAALLQAELLTAIGAVDDARQQLGKALAAQPDHVRARVMLARVQVLQEQVDEGLAALAAAADDAPADFSAHYYLADALKVAGRYEESLKAFDRALAINGESADAWFGLSLAALALRRDSQSEAAMHQVLRLDRKPAWYYSRARHALILGRNDIAARDVERCLDSMGWGNPSGPYAAFVGVLAQRRLGQHAEAAELLRRTVEATTAKTWARHVADYLSGSLAEDDFLNRAKDNGQRTEAHTYIGMMKALAGDRDAAVQHFQWVKTRGDRNYSEYELAVGELKRLR